MPVTTRHLLLAAVAAALLVPAAVPTAAAHATATSADGAIKVTWGWTSEPATTEAKNGLDLAIRYASNNSGVRGLAGQDLVVELRYGGESLVLDGIQVQHGREHEGRYTGLHPITPSEPGLYVLHVSGTIAGSAVDLEIPATHEVQALEETYFPPRDGASGGDTSALAERIAALEAKVAALEAEAQAQSERIVTPTQQTGGAPAGDGNGVPGAGVGLLLAALIVVAAGFARRRRA